MGKRAVYVATTWASVVFSLGGCELPSANEVPRRRGATVSFASRRDASPPLWLLRDPDGDPVRREDEDHPDEPLPLMASSRDSAIDPARQTVYSALQATAPLTSFDGLGYGFTGPAGTFFANAPPDANGDVGPNHYVQAVNFGLAVFDKTGRILYGPVKLNRLFSGFGGACEQWNNGDPIVLYDPLADRWLVSQMAGGPSATWECIAVSRGSDPTGAYYRYAFQYDAVIDYPKIGVWPDAYYVTYGGPLLCALERDKMLAGDTARQQCFTVAAGGPPLPADLDGTRPPPSGAPNTLIRYDVDKLQSFLFHVDWADSSHSVVTGPATVPGVAPFSVRCNGGPCIPQPNTAQGLDSDSGALMHRLAYRNFGDHESLVTTHTVATADAAGVRWYEFRLDSNRNPVVYQQGTYAPDSAFRWVGSAAMDRAGGIGLAFNVSSSSIYPSIRFTGRGAAEPPGTMTLSEGTLIASTGSQRNQYRWGDYASMSVDPTDECTFWFTGEYLDSLGSPQSRIGSFKLGGCPESPFDFRLQATPSALALAAGGTATLQIRTEVVSGTPENLTVSTSGLPAGVSAVFAPPKVMAGHPATLTLSAAASAPPTQSATLTINAASGTVAHTSSVVLSVSSAGISIALTPAAVSVTAGSSATVAVQTNPGPAGVVKLSATGAPAGVTLSFEPPAVAIGNSAVLTVAASPDASAVETDCTIGARFGASLDELPLHIVVVAVPTVSWISPPAGSMLSGTATLVAAPTISRGAALQKVEFLVDGISAGVATTSPASLAWNTALASNGTHRLSASVVDSAGNSASTPAVAVVVQNAEGEAAKGQGCGSAGTAPLGALLCLVWSIGHRRGRSHCRR
jgi:hypothetical protein